MATPRFLSRGFSMALVLVLVLVFDLPTVANLSAADAKAIDFDRQIRPILSDNCFSCHGPDAAQRQAELRLDMREDAVKHGAIRDNAVDDAAVKESPLLARILSTDSEERMPPTKSNKQLTDAQKELLSQWVRQGAKYTQHWSFTPTRRPEVPDRSRPVDSLVEQRLKSEGLQFSSPAEPATLARRLSLDLIGLPPTESQVASLTNDPSLENISRLADELIASPHYGERMAIGWLDVVRFADTIGYHSDTPRNVFPYRDYVIAAFNNNKPFDQFTIEQVAGDLLPDATQEQRVASCFNRLLLTTEEGGAQPKDYEARYMADRVRAIGTTWLGLTIGCSQCHDHKFDPVTMQDFYSLGAFFADIDEAIIGKREEGLLVSDVQQANKLQLLKASVKDLTAEMAIEHPRLADEQTAWEQKQLAIAHSANSWKPMAPREASASAGSILTINEDRSILASGPRPEKEVYQLSFSIEQDAMQSFALRLEALPHPSLPAGGSGRADNGNFVLTEVAASVVRKDGESQSLKLAAARASIEQKPSAEKHPDKRWSASSVIDNDAQGETWGWAILPDVTKPQQLQLKFAEPLDLRRGDTLRIEMKNNHGNAGHLLGNFRWSTSNDSLAYESPLDDARFAELVAIIQVDAAKRSDEQKSKLRTAFHAVTPSLAVQRQKLADTEKQLSAFEASLPRCLISKSLAKPRTVRILPRGNWLDESGPIVAPRLPAFLTSTRLPSDRPLTRLDLARWLVADDNPLTARVYVNRLWKQFFGLGLSRNLDDLGAQGEAPSNAPLLDYLASEFVQSGWNTKHIVRLIVTSRTYQQSSQASPELLQRDPENRFLARQSRFRMPAELVRDNALAISGLLSRQIGGPSVRPYQPEGYWENLNFPVRSYNADSAPAQHRRGLYVWWQRSFVHPSMLAFDAPTREECAADRAQSNIPQQALVLLNDPTYVEAAKSLTNSMLEARESDLKKRIQLAFRTATARNPSNTELELLVKLHAASLDQFQADIKSAESLRPAENKSDIPPAEWAAYFQVARAILNLHEVITRS